MRMAQVEVRDHVIWTKHIHGSRELQMTLDRLPAEQTLILRVAGEVGTWRKMRRNATTGAGTPGLQPVGPAASRWRTLYREAKRAGGALVDIELVQPLTESDPATFAPSRRRNGPTLEERAAAWEAIKELWRTGGLRSDAPYGPRDELHEREPHRQ